MSEGRILPISDTLALSVLALRCVAETSSRSVERHLKGPVSALVTRQEADGGFGNFHSTLLAVQASRYTADAQTGGTPHHRRPAAATAIVAGYNHRVRCLLLDKLRYINIHYLKISHVELRTSELSARQMFITCSFER